MTGRVTTEPSFLDLVDRVACGGMDEWRTLYRASLRDPSVRADILRAARLVEPDFADAGALWIALVARMPMRVALRDSADDHSTPR